jgi:hypothetical protein
MKSKTTAIVLATSAAAIVAPGAAAAISTASTLNGAGSWSAGLHAWANSWVIPSNAPNGSYDWNGNVNSSTTSGTVADDGFYYAGISFSGTGLVGTTNGSSLSIVATSSAPVTVTFTFDARVKAAGFLVSLASPALQITMFVNGDATTPHVMAIDPAANGGGTGLGFLGAMADATGSETSISTLTLTINAGQTVALSGAYLQLVPAPGALALLGAAGIVGGRRRRS